MTDQPEIDASASDSTSPEEKRREILTRAAKVAAELEVFSGALTDRDEAFLDMEVRRQLAVLRYGGVRADRPPLADARRQELLRAYAEAVAVATHVLAPLTNRDVSWMAAEYQRQLGALRESAGLFADPAGLGSERRNTRRAAGNAARTRQSRR